MLSFEVVNGLILGACGLGLLWAILNAYYLSKIRIGSTPNGDYENFQDYSD